MAVTILGAGLLLGGLAVFLMSRRLLRLSHLTLHSRSTEPRIAILIPARDESRVIEGLLRSIQRQSHAVQAEDVYVILESNNDPSRLIAEQYGNSVILRKDLSKQRKGYALSEAVREILGQGKHYDLYFVFDADNILAKDFLEQMLKSYRRGYEMVIGYRAAKNANDNVISAVSSLTFSMINVLGNHKRKQLGANIIFSGTGCYVSGSLVEKWGGWPFHSLTEDYEMSLYAMVKNISTDYNEEAVFYDEQPVEYAETVAQRTRWIKGYFAARKLYLPRMRELLRQSFMQRKEGSRPENLGSLLKELIGVKPVIVMLVGAILLLIDGLFIRPIGVRVDWLWLAVGVVVLVYAALLTVTVVMIKRERHKLRRGLELGALLFNPIYLLTYVWCALKALFTKDVKWQKTKHGK